MVSWSRIWQAERAFTVEQGKHGVTQLERLNLGPGPVFFCFCSAIQWDLVRPPGSGLGRYLRQEAIQWHPDGGPERSHAYNFGVNGRAIIRHSLHRVNVPIKRKCPTC